MPNQLPEHGEEEQPVSLYTWEALSQCPEEFFALHQAYEKKLDDATRAVTHVPENLAIIDEEAASSALSYEEFTRYAITNEKSGRALVDRINETSHSDTPEWVRHRICDILEAMRSMN